MFWWLGLALFVDAIDGPLARKYDVAHRLPRWSGDALDFVIDYATYVFIPAFALYQSGLLSEAGAIFCAAIITVTGALYFAYRDMKMPDCSFRGFPAVWNAVIFGLFVFKPAPELTIMLVVAFGVLTFLPVKFIHPVRVKMFRPLTLAMTVVWSLFAGLALYYELNPPESVIICLAIASAYMFCIGFVVQFTEWHRARSFDHEIT